MDKLKMIKEDEHLNSYIKENKISDQMIEDYYSSFYRVLESRNKCRNCKGLYQCAQKSVGERLSLAYMGVVVEEVEYCDYMLKDKSTTKLLGNYVYSDIPEILKDIDLDNIEYTDSQKELFAYLLGILHDKRNKGLYISGDLGVGKTYLCIGLANSLVKENKKVAYVKVSNFISDMKGYIGTNSDLLKKNIENLKMADYLFLDDLGSEAVSEFVRDDILFTILDYRLENNLMTIITSNLNFEDLLKHYQYDRKEKSNISKAKRLVERIDILTDKYTLVGKNMRRI